MEMEIGPKTVPWIDHLRSNFLTGGQRVLVERDLQAADLLRKTQKGATVITGSAEDLAGVGDESVGVVLAKDFFGAHGKFPATISGIFLRVRENIGDWGRMANEWYRVCQDGGRVVVVETSTPADKNKVLEVFGQAGFKLVEEKSGIDVWDVFENVPKRKMSQDDRAYALVFEK